MSLSHEYHQPDAPDSPTDDTDSDLDLDLHELDPATGTQSRPSPAVRGSLEHARNSLHDLGNRIPLRNLRVGRRRPPRTQSDDFGDSRGLAHNGEPKMYTAGSFDADHEDDAPLLNTSHGRRRRKDAGTLERIGSRISLPSFIAGPSSGEALPSTEPEPDNKHNPAANRTVAVGQAQSSRYPPNAVSNAKYTPWSFLPRTLYNEFSFFFNMYFLLVALSQIIPALRIGYLSTYIAPLAFVLMITLGKEAADDITRRRRDAEANSEAYTVLRFEESSYGTTANGSGNRGILGKRKRKANGMARRLTDLEEEEQSMEGGGKGQPTASFRELSRTSKDLKVGDVVKMTKNQRVPADMVILRSYTSENKTLEGERASSTEQRPSADLIDAANDNPSAVDPEPNGTVEQAAQPPEINNAELSGEAFIRTDQLDGETDWKLRLASPLSQSLDICEYTRLRVLAGKPDRKVNEFVGIIELLPRERHSSYDPHIDKDAPPDGSAENQSQQASPLTIDNTAWANTVLASSSAVLAVVIYTGPQTRQALSTSPSRSKAGLLEYEINSLTKILCALTLTVSLLLVALGRYEQTDQRRWYVSVMRFLILFSTIVPISLRVNLDMGKSVYAWFIEKDEGIPGTVVRTSTIPEDLGRIEYLLSDKTGTLTQNEMELKKIHIGTVSYAGEAMEEVCSYVRQGLSVPPNTGSPTASSLVTPSSSHIASTSATRTRREIGSRVLNVVMALAICHNVTPTTEEHENGDVETTYQASSPDEIAIVKWTSAVGLRLLQRDRHSMSLQSTATGQLAVRVRILNVFPFTSEGKRMGIVVKFEHGAQNRQEVDEEIWFFQKGADTVMSSIVAPSDWLDEETANMAREGLRTLVIGRKRLSSQQYAEFSAHYTQASVSLQSRDTAMADVVKKFLETDLELLGVTGVEDRLQKDVKPSLELLRNAGIKIWMLTGDKVETARCVAISSKLVARNQPIQTITKLKRKDLAPGLLNQLQQSSSSALLIDGESLGFMLTHHRNEFIAVAVKLPAVIACRCSPTQKADVAHLIRSYTKKRVCCIGDGGNDVSMIQAADVGVGVVGKEGRQASLAADFSVDQFCYLTKLLLWHGRNSYKRSAKLAQFVIHRGLIVSVCQVVYSVAARFEPIALYKVCSPSNLPPFCHHSRHLCASSPSRHTCACRSPTNPPPQDWLLVGYATAYTALPVFSLVLDRDVSPHLAHLYPELYAELTAGRSLSHRTFFIWCAISLYQGLIIQGGAQLLVGLGRSADGGVDEGAFKKMVAVSYTVLVLNELMMVAAEVVTWHWVMVACIVGTAASYAFSVPFLGRYFDLGFVWSVGFIWRVLLIGAVALVPVWGGKVIGRTIRPPSYRKVRGV